MRRTSVSMLLNLAMNSTLNIENCFYAYKFRGMVLCREEIALLYQTLGNILAHEQLWSPMLLKCMQKGNLRHWYVIHGQARIE
jgi:hypothetical protein